MCSQLKKCCGKVQCANNEDAKTIASALAHIKEQCGLSLKVDEHFKDVYSAGGGRCFHVDIEERTWSSNQMAVLERLAQTSSVVKKVEVSGHSRVAIFI